MWDWLINLLRDYFGIAKLGTIQGNFFFVLQILNTLFVILFAYRFVFTLVGFFHKKVVYPESKKKHRIAALIFARNEESVIATGINSINIQDYPKEYIDKIVVAHNCTDNTAKIAKEKGCIVYEINEPDKPRKGWAMENFFKKIQEDHLIDNYDAFIILDADCIISKNFFTKMNDAYGTGKYEVIVGYPDTVNFNDNFISAAYGYNYYRLIMSCHRPKAVLNVGDGGCGTGWLISANIIKKEGWDSHTLTEDAEYVVALATKGYKFGFCEEAHVYIEHPTNFIISCRQRLRCAKGVLGVFVKRWGRLFLSFLKRPSMTKYDSLCEVFPYGIVNFTLTIAYQILALVIALTSGGEAWDFFKYIVSTCTGICIGSWFLAILITIREWKSINAPLPKVLLYILVFPWFDLLAIPISFLCLFMRVRWKKIPHKSTKDNDTLEDELHSLNK